MDAFYPPWILASIGLVNLGFWISCFGFMDLFHAGSEKPIRFLQLRWRVFIKTNLKIRGYPSINLYMPESWCCVNYLPDEAPWRPILNLNHAFETICPSELSIFDHSLPYCCKSRGYCRSKASGGEAVVNYREPPATKEMQCHRLSRRVKSMGKTALILDVTWCGFHILHVITTNASVFLKSYPFPIIFMQL